MQPCRFCVLKPLKNRAFLLDMSCQTQKKFHRQTHTHTQKQSTFQLKMMKYEVEHYRLEWQSARDCAGLLSHCLLLPEREEKGEEKRGEETVNGEKQVRHIEISFFFIIYFWDFLYGNSRRFQQLSTAQPVVWVSAQAFHMYEVWQQGKQPPT